MINGKGLLSKEEVQEMRNELATEILDLSGECLFYVLLSIIFCIYFTYVNLMGSMIGKFLQIT